MRVKIWIAITLLVLASMACSLGGKVESVSEAETAIPTEIGDVGDETSSEEIDAKDLSGLESYRMRTVAQWTPGGDAPQEGYSMEMEYTKNPPASRMVMENEGGKIEWVQIEDASWLCQAGTCTQYAGSAEDVASTFGAFSLDPTSLTADSDSEYVGRETVNGINARHYTLKLNALQVAAMAQGDVTDIHSDAWIADEADRPSFVTRYTLTWKETRGEQKGTYEYTYDVYDVNTPITIEPPEGATGFPEDVPAYSNTKDLFITEGMITFSTSDDVATVTDFYRSELAAKGWTKTSDEEMAGLIQQVWNKDEQTLSLMLSPAEDGGTSVIISIE